MDSVRSDPGHHPCTFKTSRLDPEQYRRRDELISKVRAGVPPPDARGKRSLASVSVWLHHCCYCCCCCYRCYCCFSCPPPPSLSCPPQEKSARLQSKAPPLRTRNIRRACRNDCSDTSAFDCMDLPPPHLHLSSFTPSRLVLSAQS